LVKIDEKEGKKKKAITAYLIFGLYVCDAGNLLMNFPLQSGQ